MEIGSGTLEMAQDEALEKRIEFWTKIWQKVPTYQRYMKSETWKNSKLYLKTSEDSKSSKVEL